MPQQLHRDDELTTFTIKDALRILDALGPMPAEALSVMVDYGFSDAEIGQHFGLPQNTITTLRAHWRFDRAR